MNENGREVNVCSESILAKGPYFISKDKFGTCCGFANLFWHVASHIFLIANARELREFVDYNVSQTQFNLNPFACKPLSRKLQGMIVM